MEKMSNDEFMDFFRTLKEKAKKAGTSVFDYVKKLQSALDEMGGFGALLKWASHMEEKTCDSFSFADAMTWIKPKLDAGVHGGAIIHKKEVDPKNYDGKKLMIKISFASKNGSPLNDLESDHLIVLCDTVDNDLKNYFGTKDMIVLK